MKSRIGMALGVLYPNEFGERRRGGSSSKKRGGFVHRRLSSLKIPFEKYGKLRVLACVIGLLVVISGVYTIYAYNRFTAYSNDILANIGNIESEKQRRNDLINNLVPPTVNYLVFERELFSHVAEIRKELTTLDGILNKEGFSGDDLTAPVMSAKMPTLMGIFENYPDLKASKPFTDLMNELVATENRVAAARNSLNGSINVYNTFLLTVPAYWVAKVLGYENKTWFQANEGADAVPDMRRLDTVNLESLMSKEMAAKIGNYISE